MQCKDCRLLQDQFIKFYGESLKATLVLTSSANSFVYVMHEDAYKGSMKEVLIPVTAFMLFCTPRADGCSFRCNANKSSKKEEQ